VAKRQRKHFANKKAADAFLITVEGQLAFLAFNLYRSENYSFLVCHSVC
jgi:hypothetical protein